MLLIVKARFADVICSGELSTCVFLDEKSEESVRFKIFLNPNELSYGLKTLDPIFVLALLQSLPDTLLETVSHNPLRHVLPTPPTPWCMP